MSTVFFVSRMSKPPRRHHFVPASYLAGFTSSGDRDDHLSVFDTQEGRAWKAKPDEVAHERDFYRISGDGQDEFSLETALSQVENELIPHMRAVITAGQMIPDSLQPILAFFSIQIVRSTGMREIVQELAEYAASPMLLAMSASSEAYSQALGAMRVHGDDVTRMPASPEMFREMMEARGITVEFDRTAVIREAFSHVGFFYAELTSRNWCLAAVQPDAGLLLTSDNPLHITALADPDPKIAAKLRLPPGDWVFPLSPRFALIGRASPVPRDVEIGREAVAMANRSVMEGGRYLYSPSSEFNFWKNDGSLGSHADVLSESGWR